MNEENRNRLYALCSWLETRREHIVPDLEDAFYDELEQGQDSAKVGTIVAEIKKSSRTRFLDLLDGEKEKQVGFAFCAQQMHRDELFNEAISEVKEKGLLTNAMEALRTPELTDDEKIVVLLGSSERLPLPHQRVKANLVFSTRDLETGKRRFPRIPVNVVIANNQVVDVILTQSKQNEK